MSNKLARAVPRRVPRGRFESHPALSVEEVRSLSGNHAQRRRRRRVLDQETKRTTRRPLTLMDVPAGSVLSEATLRAIVERKLDLETINRPQQNQTPASATYADKLRRRARARRG